MTLPNISTSPNLKQVGSQTLCSCCDLHFQTDFIIQVSKEKDQLDMDCMCNNVNKVRQNEIKQSERRHKGVTKQ